MCLIPRLQEVSARSWQGFGKVRLMLPNNSPIYSTASKSRRAGSRSSIETASSSRSREHTTFPGQAELRLNSLGTVDGSDLLQPVENQSPPRTNQKSSLSILIVTTATATQLLLNNEHNCNDVCLSILYCHYVF